MVPQLQRQKSAKVVARRVLTADSVELEFAFSDGSTFDYLPGQFVQIFVSEPKEDEEWYRVGKEQVFHYLMNNPNTSLAELGSAFPCPHAHVEMLLSDLVGDGAVEERDGVYSGISQISLGDTTLKPFMRPYSLGSSPLMSTFSTMIKEVPDGYFSKYAVSLGRLAVGDVVLVTGPLGHFALPEEGVGKLLLIGAGSGITPLIGMMRHLALSGRELPTTLLYSNKTEEDIIYRDELDCLSTDHEYLDVIHTLTRVTEEHTWGGRRGRIDTGLLSEYASGNDTLIFICGPLHFGRSMRELLVGECGVDGAKVKMEAYG